jgi:hypothetical protein
MPRQVIGVTDDISHPEIDRLHTVRRLAVLPGSRRGRGLPGRWSSAQVVSPQAHAAVSRQGGIAVVVLHPTAPEALIKRLIHTTPDPVLVVVARHPVAQVVTDAVKARPGGYLVPVSRGTLARVHAVNDTDARGAVIEWLRRGGEPVLS